MGGFTDFNGDNDVSNRNDWEFEYTASMLAQAAEEKKVYRESRVKWWEDKQKEIMAEVKDGGLEVNESVAAAYSSNATRGPQVMVRADLQQKLNECHTKIREHQTAVRSYDGWRQVLGANPASRLKLKHNDWLFFFGED